jgi:hypothetical protein
MFDEIVTTGLIDEEALAHAAAAPRCFFRGGRAVRMEHPRRSLMNGPSLW